MPVTIDEVTAEVDSGAPRPPAADGEAPGPAGEEAPLEERLRLAEARAQRVRAD